MTATLTHRLYNYALIMEFIAYVVFLSSFFYSKDSNNFSFIYISFTFYLITYTINFFQRHTSDEIINEYVTKNSKSIIPNQISPIFFIITIYILDLLIVNEIKSDVSSFNSITDAILAFMRLVFFLIITNHLALKFNKFFSKLFLLMSFMVSLNALYYLESYWLNIPPLLSGGLPRLGLEMMTIGLAPGDYPPTYGLVYAIFCAPCLILAIKTRNSFTKFFLVFEFLVLLSAILFTQTREDIIALFAALMAYFAINNQITLLRRIQIISFILVFVVSILIYVGFNRANFDGWRIELIKKFIDHALEHPFLGYGQKPFKLIISSGEAIGHGHNLLLNAELRGGIIALSCMAVIIFYGFYRAYQFYKLSDNAIPFVIISILAVAGMVDYDAVVISQKGWQWIGIWFPIFLIAGVDTLLRSKDFNQKS